MVSTDHDHGNEWGRCERGGISPRVDSVCESCPSPKPDPRPRWQVAFGARPTEARRSRAATRVVRRWRRDLSAPRRCEWSGGRSLSAGRGHRAASPDSGDCAVAVMKAAEHGRAVGFGGGPRGGQDRMEGQPRPGHGVGRVADGPFWLRARGYRRRLAREALAPPAISFEEWSKSVRPQSIQASRIREQARTSFRRRADGET